MASPGKNSENLNILKEIYHDDRDKIQPRKSFREYFQDSQRIDKLLSGAILFFGLVAIILGFFQFKANLRRGFFTSPLANQTAGILADDLLGLSQKDTDGDSLSDYDELYLYQTSPYLKDSDSDGTEDAKEVASGTDPNCPAGQNCFAEWGEQTESISPQVSDLLFKGQFQAEQLRQLLKQAGMSEADLAQFSDQQLLETYQQVLSQGQAEQAGQSAKTINLPAEQLGELTPAQVRQLLAEAGISQEVLDNVSDEELMALVKETLAE